MGINFGVNPFEQSSFTSGVTSNGVSENPTTDADLKEYKSLLDKKSKGMLTSREQNRLKELQGNLSKAGKLNQDGSVKSRTNNDRLKANARKMSWDDVASVLAAIRLLFLAVQHALFKILRHV